MSCPAQIEERLTTGHWIWAKDDMPEENIYVYFRKTFELRTPPQSALCHITAERFYRLWVNGKVIGQGPAWEDPEERSYDTHAISSFVREGRNVVAVLVHMPFNESGRHNWKRIYIDPSRPGLFCQLHITDRDARATRMGTDAGWKARRALAWAEKAPFRNDLSMQEWYDFNADPHDWNQADYDDAEWPQAVVIGDVQGKASDGGFLPWRKLVPRRFPMPRRQTHFAKRARTGEVLESINPLEMGNPAVQMSLEKVRPLQKADVQSAETLLSEQGKCVLRNSDPHESLDSFDGVRCATLILDFGRVMNAHVRIELEGEQGAVLHVGYAQTLLEEEVRPYRSDRGANADRLTLSKGQLSWQSFEYRSFRYVQLTLRLAVGPVVLRRVSADEVTQSWPTQARFECSDQHLQRIWEAGVATIRLCTPDRWCDNSVRENRQYLYESAIGLSTAMAVYGDCPFFHQYLQQMFKRQLPNGNFLVCYPGMGRVEWLETEAFLYGLPALWEHYEAFCQQDFLAEFWVKIPAFLDLWHSHVNSRGMISSENAPGSHSFLDWGLHEIHGENAGLNCLFLKNLRCAEAMAKVFGDKKLAACYREWGDPIEEHLHDDFWNEQKTVFSEALLDGRQSELAAEYSLGMMMQMGLVDPQQVDRMVRAWTLNPDLVEFGEPAGLLFAVEGLIRYRHVEFALHLLRQRMSIFLDQGLQSLGELWKMFGSYHNGVWRTTNSRSVAQASSAWPPLTFARHIAGVQPELGTRGLVRLAPLPVVQSVDARAYGIDVKWFQAKGRWRLAAQFPRETKVEFVLPFAKQRVSAVVLNGKNVPSIKTEMNLGRQSDLNLELTLE